ncbi:hypothetical protein CF319_g7345 [Tilletia indica]|nr:hypothetical protein CF326_g10004 [Tilletia indica]KAE8218854.1 hypothetical protein CF319_g7345 [Tilletia indica]
MRCSSSISRLNVTSRPPHFEPPSPDGPGAGIPKDKWRWAARIHGWASALIYLISRIPQMINNCKTYCKGLPMTLFVFDPLEKTVGPLSPH